MKMKQGKSYLPLPFEQALRQERSFSDESMNSLHKDAAESFTIWRNNKDTITAHEDMIDDLNKFLEEACQQKEQQERHKSKVWKLGYNFALRQMSFLFLSISCTILMIVFSCTETYPGKIQKAIEIRILDVFCNITEFLILLLHDTVTTSALLVDLIAFISTLSFKAGQAFLIARLVQPADPVEGTVGYFNALCPAIVAGVRHVHCVRATPVMTPGIFSGGAVFENVAPFKERLTDPVLQELLMSVMIGTIKVKVSSPIDNQ
ncbi:uncharacterized protein H6S33_011683 [Morchella sextelata]|uniref:uncharacterized protein n=1 Tax=Morchella sextelata TaxID=1174677 RepID=UPI001D057015|nr:uncharacterized protein H6S33_011683 [Morchella sextelata]KAH0611256.1 hypothetical protein H6S33_011683 [Morchella sextelata]